MPRIDLAVPYSERRDARQLGAAWDRERRVWYVPDDRDPSPFCRWLQPGVPINVRSRGFWVASGQLPCWRCRGLSRVHGFALPPGHETLFVDEDTGEVIWEESEEPSFVCYLEYVSPNAVETMQQRTPNYRLALRRRTATHYWANACQFCASKLGDYDVFCEPGQGFMPVTREEAASITLLAVDAPFSATAGGWSLGVDLFAFITELP